MFCNRLATHYSRVAAILVGMLSLCFWLGASSAQAHFEWVGLSGGTFARLNTEGELGGVAGGIAVNYGCYVHGKEVGHALSPTECEAYNPFDGRVYVADGIHARVTVFDSHGKFIEGWGWDVSGDGTKAFQRCGPDVPAHLTCGVTGEQGEGVGQFFLPEGVAVDQTTGDVFVLDARRHNGVVQVFSAKGELLFSFGVQGGEGEPVTEHPELIRGTDKSGIAVDQLTGDVYVADREGSRVMVFKRVSPEDYVYEKDFALGLGPEELAVDSAGNVYVTSLQKSVYKFTVGTLSSPEWVHEDNKDIGGLTVSAAEGGDIFYYTKLNRKFHELNPAGVQIQGGEWEGIEIEEKIAGVTEKRKENETNGLAFNPGLVWEVGRPVGVLYAIDPNLIAGLIWAQPPLHEPSIGLVEAKNVGTGSAELEASINPHGVDTHYHFQYGTEDCIEHACTKEAPIPAEGDVGSGGEPVAVTASVTGLVPDTKYYFRVVASSHCNSEMPTESCVVNGPPVAPASSFTTFSLSASSSVDGRMYELVSPLIKAGGEVYPLSATAANCELCMPGVSKEHFPMQSTADGGMMVYEGDPFAGTGDATSENEYLSVRGAGGWSLARDLSPVLEGKATPQGYKAFSSDLSKGVLYEIERSFEGAPSNYPDLYLEDASSGSLRPLITEAPLNRGSKEFQLMFAGASSDFSHLVFEANGVLATEDGFEAPNGTATEENLYEWVNGRLSLVNVLPDETTETSAALGGGSSVFSNVISADGSKVFWTDENHAHGHFGHVYVRVNGEKTLEVPDGEGGSFLSASTDGSRVLLGDGRVYNVGDEEVVEKEDLTGGQHGFQGILGTSKDLSTVYFVDTAVLTGTEENGEGAKAKAGEDNLYLSREGSVRFIATLSSGDNATDVYETVGLGDTGDWSNSSSNRTAQVTPDGQYVAFMSQASLTGYDNHTSGGGQCLRHSVAPTCFEVYEYDSSTERLVCASCNPTEEHPTGPSLLSVVQPGSGFLPQPLNLSENGRLFFDSYDELSPQDTNGNFEDVYEYEPDGLGTCAKQVGCIFLISSGQEETNSSFVNATPSGSDIFFTTYSRLVPQDQDGLMDLYDDRVGGSSPPPPPPPPCMGDECRTSVPSEPVFGSSSSSILSGSGNLMTSLPPLAPPSSLPISKPLTRAQLLAKALKACRKQQAKKARIGCESRARTRYGGKTKSKATRVRTKKISGKGTRSSK